MELSAHPLARLSFFDGPTNDLWAVDATGDYAADCIRGGTIADELVSDMRSTGVFPLLGHVAQAINVKGPHAGVEIGFWQRIAEYLA